MSIRVSASHANRWHSLNEVQSLKFESATVCHANGSDESPWEHILWAVSCRCRMPCILWPQNDEVLCSNGVDHQTWEAQCCPGHELMETWHQEVVCSLFVVRPAVQIAAPTSWLEKERSKTWGTHDLSMQQVTEGEGLSLAWMFWIIIWFTIRTPIQRRRKSSWFYWRTKFQRQVVSAQLRNDRAFQNHLWLHTPVFLHFKSWGWATKISTENIE